MRIFKHKEVFLHTETAFKTKMALVVAVLISALYLNGVAAIPLYYMDQLCGKTLNLANLGDAVRLKLTARSSYKPNMDCSLLITSSEHLDRFMLYFESFSIQASQGCVNDWLEVHDGRAINTPYVSGLPGKQCGSFVSKTVRTTSGYNLFLRFKSDSAWQRKGFDMVITQYHTGQCNNSEFTCSNGRCISDSLICNGYNPCGDYSDCALVVIAVGVIVAIVIVSLVSVIIILALSVICCRRRRQRLRYGVYQPVNVVATTGYGTGYNQPVSQPYRTANYPTGQQYATGQQKPTAQYPNQPYQN